MNKKELLDLLEDKEVQDKIYNGVFIRLKNFILKIFNIKDNSSLIMQNKELENQISALQARQKQLELENKQLQKDKELLKNAQKEFVYYEKFLNLSSQTKDSLKNILKSENIITFISFGVQAKNIENFWDYINNELKEGKNIDIKNLIEIFYFLFKNYTNANSNIYELQDVNIGDEFDYQRFLMHNSSTNTSGNIKEVILRGIVNSKTKEIKRKSIVRI